MAELRTSAVIELSGNLEQRAQRYGRAIRDFSQTGVRHLRRLDRAAGAVGRGLDAIGNRWTALGAGAAGIGTLRMLVRHEERMTRLGITAQMTADQVHALNKRIYEAAQAPNIRVDPGQITAAIEEIVEKTGDLQFATDNIRNIGLAIQATGARGSDIGAIMAEFQKMGIKRPEEVLKVIDTLNVQGKAGAFTLQALARLGPRVITAYAGAGRSGAQALRELGAALQVIRMGTGNAEQAATAFEATIRTLTDPAKIEKLRAVGIEVFDPEKMAQGVEVLRPINELMVEIVNAAGGARSKIGTIFDAEAMRAFNQVLGEFKRTGSIESLERFMSVQADGTQTIQDASRAADTASAALTNLFTAWQRFADSNLTEPIQDLADALNSIDPQQLQNILNVAKWTAIGLGGALLLKKGIDGIRWARRGRGFLGGAVGAATDAVTPEFPIPLPVYVVNRKARRRLSKMGRGAGAADDVASTARRGSRVGRAFRSAGKVALPLGIGYGAGTLLNETAIDGTAASNVIGRTVAMILAGLGSDSARQALMAEAEARGRLSVMRGELDISITDDRVRVDRMRGENLDMDVGPAMPAGS